MFSSRDALVSAIHWRIEYETCGAIKMDRGGDGGGRRVQNPVRNIEIRQKAWTKSKRSPLQFSITFDAWNLPYFPGYIDDDDS